MSERTKLLMEAIEKVNEAINCTTLNGDYVSMTAARHHLKAALKSAKDGDVANMAHLLAMMAEQDYEESKDIAEFLLGY